MPPDPATTDLDGQSSPTTPYLDGPFAPIDTEITAEQLPVRGQLPRDLQGVFIRNGANPKFRPAGRHHWFDGDGMLHGLYLSDGAATYRNRYVRTSGLASDEAAGSALTGGILEPPDVQRVGGPYKNTGNTDIVYHDGKLLALWWLGGAAHQVRVEDLVTIGEYTFGGALQRGIASHPKIDPVTGEMMFFDYALQPPFMYYGVVDRQGNVSHQIPVELPGPRLQHDMAITRNYTILFDFPLYWDPRLLAHGKTRVVFNPELPSRFGVLPRYGTSEEVRWFEAPACYMYHTINAYEEGDALTLLGCSIRNPIAAERSAPQQWPRLDIIELEPYLTQWRFDLSAGTVSDTILDDVPTEFPRMNDGWHTQLARYSYNPRIARTAGLLFDGLIKYDLQSGTSEALDYDPGTFGGETVFAPRPNTQDEDDGYLLTFVTDGTEKCSELWITDAREVSTGPVARVQIPQRVPIGYHACWIPAERITA